MHTRAAWLALDHSDADLRRMVRNGALTRPGHGWYAATDADPDAVLAAARGGALTCTSACAKHGLWVPPGYSSLHVRAAKHAQGRRRDFCRAPGRPLPVTSILDEVPLALACAAGCMAGEDWIALCDSAMNTLGVDVEGMRSMMPRVSMTIDRLLARCEPQSQSGTESLTRVRLRALGFPVEVQPYIEGVGRVDLRLGRLLIECDSKLHHTSLHSYTNDRHRDRTSLSQKLITMRLTYDDVLYDWDSTLADIRAVIDAGMHRPQRRKSSR